MRACTRKRARGLAQNRSLGKRKDVYRRAPHLGRGYLPNQIFECGAKARVLIARPSQGKERLVQIEQALTIIGV